MAEEIRNLVQHSPPRTLVGGTGGSTGELLRHGYPIRAATVRQILAGRDPTRHPAIPDVEGTS